MKRGLSFIAFALLLTVSALHAQSTESFGATNPKGGEEELGVFIPNAFTPNNDGVNDVYYIPDANFTKFEFSVYDRWGNRVFFSDQPSFRWNGDSGGRQLASGVYVYVLVATSGKREIKRSGTITIVR